MTLNVEVFFVPGCANCGNAVEQLKTIDAEIGGGRIQWREVDVVAEIDYAVALGVRSTPSIAVDGKLAFSVLPSFKKLRRYFEQRLTDA